MSQCLILGDSIAKGLSMFVKGCAVTAKVGMSSAWILAHAHSGHFNTVYISAGSNDPYNIHLASNLVKIRGKYSSSRVIWIAPVNGRAKAIVHGMSRYGDIVVDFSPGRDHIHPRSYQALARSVR